MMKLRQERDSDTLWKITMDIKIWKELQLIVRQWIETAIDFIVDSRFVGKVSNLW